MAKRLNNILDDDEDEDDEYHSRQKTVLVIEKNYSYRCKLVEKLKQKGYRVVTAEEGFEGIRKYDLINPDVVIIGKDLSNMDGVATARILRKHHPSSNIILTARYPLSEDKYHWIRPYKALNRSDTYLKLGQTIEDLFEEERRKYRSYFDDRGYYIIPIVNLAFLH